MASTQPSAPTRHNPWDPQTDHDSNGQPRDDYPTAIANGNYTPSSSSSSSSTSSPSSPSAPFLSSSTTTDPTKSPSAISLRAFLLGATFSASVLLTIHLALPPFTPSQPQTTSNPLWRLPTFLALLSLFHYLEYHATALANPPAATTTSAFLLSSNGKAYNIAHGAAFIEAFLHHYYNIPPYPFPSRIYLTLGITLIILGQTVRTTAMLHAGTNFNHLVQRRKKQGHVLVTGGVYRYLRHPSYFGFFWWGLGTQVVLGNVVCLVGYAVVLWRFFRRRIEKEETLLIGFFGMDYVRYRDRTRVGIPLIP